MPEMVQNQGVGAKNRKHAARRYLVRGSVQGVGYRVFASNAANLAGVIGWARNLDDGRVEVYAIGEPEQLSFFEGRLRQGPHFSDVRGVDASDDVIDAGVRGFGIRH
jgi:acylphosphatase